MRPRYQGSGACPHAPKAQSSSVASRGSSEGRGGCRVEKVRTGALLAVEPSGHSMGGGGDLNRTGDGMGLDNQN